MKGFLGRSFFNRGRTRLLITAGISFPLLLLLILPGPPDLLAGAPIKAVPNELPLPVAYQKNGRYPTEHSGICSDRYGSPYLRKFSRRATNMCEDGATSSLTCFTHRSWDTIDDQFCWGSAVVLDPVSTPTRNASVSLDCPLRNFTIEEQKTGALMLDNVEMGWYGTGVRYFYEKWMHNGTRLQDGPQDRTSMNGQDRIALLVKREGGNVVNNAWHQLMQVMQLWASLDILRITKDPATGQPMYTDEDVKNTQVVIMDEEPMGPFRDVWNMFGDLPTVRFGDWKRAPKKALFPLSGGWNPVWITRSETPPCSEAPILKTFVKRMLAFYDFPALQPTKSGKLKLGWVDRHNYRVLLDQENHLAALRVLLYQKYPNIGLEIVDFGKAATFRQQIEMARDIDILVGVHGAGLTHTLWLPPGSTVVELQPPAVKYFGFEMLARWMGHGYFQQYTDKVEYEGMQHEWQADNVSITTAKFLGVVETAIKKRKWQMDYHDRRLGYPKEQPKPQWSA